MAIRDLRNDTRAVIDAVERGVDVVLTRRGHPIARIVRIETEADDLDAWLDEVMADALDTGLLAEVERLRRRGRHRRPATRSGVMLLFDTSAVVSLVGRASQPAASLVRGDGDRPFVSFVTIAELHVCVEMSRDDPMRSARRRTLHRARRFRQLPIDEPILDHYATARQCGLRGNDAWFAAAAQQLGATLVTADEVFAQRASTMVEVRLLPA